MRNELYIDGQMGQARQGRQLRGHQSRDRGGHPPRPPAATEPKTSTSPSRRPAVPSTTMAGRRNYPAAQRAVYLRAIADGIRDAPSRRLARLEVLDNGKPFPEADWDVADAAGCFDFYAGLAEQLDNNPEEAIALADARFTSKAVKEPIGVAGAIIPWNYPLLMAAWKVAPALAAGCTIVLKPAEQTSLTALELGAIAEDVGLPPGVLNIVTGAGSVAGQAIIDHKGVDKLAFTGSGPIGSKIMAAAARDIKRISLELGGKSPFVVFEDADIEKPSNGSCSASSGTRARSARRRRAFWCRRRSTSACSPASSRRRTRSRSATASMRASCWARWSRSASTSRFSQRSRARAKPGRRVACGGTTSGSDFDKGYYLEPTVLTDVPLDSDAWRRGNLWPGRLHQALQRRRRRQSSLPMILASGLPLR